MSHCSKLSRLKITSHQKFLLLYWSERVLFQDQCFHKSCKNTAHEKHMCGSDGLTYPNRCQFERARCRNKNLTLVKRGTCATQRTCMQAVQYSNTHPESGYKPHCQADGSYTPAQCHLDTGFCWCVTPQVFTEPFNRECYLFFFSQNWKKKVTYGVPHNDIFLAHAVRRKNTRHIKISLSLLVLGKQNN